MPLLRILRNLAALVMLAMAVLGSPRPAAAVFGKGCLVSGLPCNPRSLPCCRGLVCASVGLRTFCLPCREHGKGNCK